MNTYPGGFDPVLFHLVSPWCYRASSYRTWGSFKYCVTNRAHCSIGLECLGNVLTSDVGKTHFSQIFAIVKINKYILKCILSKLVIILKMLVCILIIKSYSKCLFACRLFNLISVCVRTHRILFVDEAVPYSEILAFSCVYVE